MIFGKTLEQYKFEEQQDIQKQIYGIKKFAWFPVQLQDGRKVWLGTYYEYRVGRYEYGEFKLCTHNDSPRRYTELSASRVEFNTRYGDTAPNKESLFDAWHKR